MSDGTHILSSSAEPLPDSLDNLGVEPSSLAEPSPDLLDNPLAEVIELSPLPEDLLPPEGQLFTKTYPLGVISEYTI